MESNGIYSLLPTDEIDVASELNNPDVAGLSIRCKWATAEPQQGQMQWGVFDNYLAQAVAKDKKVLIRVIAGLRSPAWIYGKGVPSFRTILGRMPIVWDLTYLRLWGEFLAKLSNRYAGHPAVVGIMMTGVGKYGEMGLNIPFVNWLSKGYTPELYVDAWRQVINAYRVLFPNQTLHLCIHKVLGDGDYDTMEQVMLWAASRYPNRVLIQANDLKESGSEYSVYIQEAALQTPVGYQMFGGREWDDAAMGDRMTAFQLGLADGISYAEVYQGDLQDLTLAETVHYLAEGLRIR